VLSIFAITRTAQQIVRLRAGKDEAKSASHFLAWLSTEKLVILAMLADAGVEALILTRAVDKEDVASEDLPFLLRGLMQRITMMFVDGGAVELGHTKWLLEALRQHPVIVYHRGNVKQLGSYQGVPQAVIDNALNRMACWARV